jgi:hypothetical protein
MNNVGYFFAKSNSLRKSFDPSTILKFHPSVCIAMCFIGANMHNFASIAMAANSGKHPDGA